MNLLTVVADGEFGGGTTHVLQLAREIMCQVGPQWYMADSDSYLESELKSMGHKVIGIRMLSANAAVLMHLRLKRLFRSVDIEVIHYHGSRARALGLFCPKGTARKIIYTVHGYHFHKNGPTKRFAKILLERASYSRSDTVVFVCEFDRKVAELTRIRAGSPKDVVIYNGIESIPSLTLTSRDIDVIFVGRMVPQKDPMLALDVLQQVSFDRAVIIGDGPLLSHVEERVRQRSWPGNVEVVGAQPRGEVLRYLQRSQVALMTSGWEGFPILSLEAMAQGCVVVGIGVGGLPEQMPQGSGDFIEPGEDREKLRQRLACALSRILADPCSRKQKAEFARNYVNEKFLATTCVAKIMDIYREA